MHHISKYVHRFVDALHTQTYPKHLFFAFVVIVVAYLFIVAGRDKSRGY